MEADQQFREPMGPLGRIDVALSSCNDGSLHQDVPWPSEVSRVAETPLLRKPADVASNSFKIIEAGLPQRMVVASKDDVVFRSSSRGVWCVGDVKCVHL